MILWFTALLKRRDLLMITLMQSSMISSFIYSAHNAQLSYIFHSREKLTTQFTWEKTRVSELPKVKTLFAFFCTQREMLRGQKTLSNIFYAISEVCLSRLGCPH